MTYHLRYQVLPGRDATPLAVTAPSAASAGSSAARYLLPYGVPIQAGPGPVTAVSGARPERATLLQERRTAPVREESGNFVIDADVPHRGYVIVECA